MARARSNSKRWLLAALLAGAPLAPGAGVGKPDDRPILIHIEPLGFQVIGGHFISTAATMFTLHFVDERHLLFTFTVRSLMARLPDQEPDDDDRTVRVLLLELPTGKILARTDWRTRDRDPYLWPLEHGRFLLRIRSKLSVIDPLRNLQSSGREEAFRQQPLMDLKHRIGFLTVSPGGDLLGVETVAPKPKLTAVEADAASLAATRPGSPNRAETQQAHRPKVHIFFFRLKPENPDGSGQLLAKHAGTIGAPSLITLPATADGFLDVQKERGNTWLLDFVSHTGKRTELAAFDTTCAPRPFFISRTEFVAFGCRGSLDKVALTYFNLRGEQPWLSALSGTEVSPSIIAAPAAGRFAFSRTLVAGPIFDTENLTAADMTAQEISVMQNYDGRTLLKLQATPIQRVGQNFDLSPLGEQFTILRAGNIEVYRLPALTGKDRKALELAQSMTPEPNDAPIKLNAVPIEVAAAGTQTSTADAAKPTPPNAQPLPAAEAMQQTAPIAAENALGDEQEGTRKPPSLFSSDYPKTKDDPKAK